MSEEKLDGKLSKERLQLLELLLQEKVNRVRLSSSPLPRISSGETSFPLSFSQERLWFINQLMPDSAAFNIFKAVRLKGRLQTDTLEKTLTEIHRRHESLRTTFEVLNDEPQQIIHPSEPFHLTVEPVEGVPPSEKETEVRKLAEAERMKTFDLKTGPLLRCRVLRLHAEEHVILLNMHHIISDGWSIGLLLKELVLIYEALRGDNASHLPEARLQYADFALWQRRQMEELAWKRQLAYWKEKLNGAPGTIELIPDRKREAQRSFCGGLESIVFPKALREDLVLFSRRHEVTLFMTLLAGFDALLFRYTGDADFTVGTPIANRRYRETEDLIGIFINTLVLRANCAGAPMFLELLERTRQTCIEAYANQDVPFEKVVEELNPKRNANEQPLFQIMFLLRNEPFEVPRCSDLEITFLPSPNRTVMFDLSLSVHDTNSELSFWMEYSSELFDASTIQRILSHFRNLLAELVKNPAKPIGELSYLTEAERQQISVGWNSAGQEYEGTEKNVVELLARMAEKCPDDIAVVFEDRQLTYAELNWRSNQLAHYLRKRGVQPEARVGISVGRSLELIVSLIGIWKAGGAYVPLDPAYPRERLEYMLRDAGVQLLVSESSLREKLPEIAGMESVCIDRAVEEIRRESGEKTSHGGIHEQNLAYVIYTSGSTGRPNGVGITFGNVRALVHWAHQVFSREELSGVLASTSICFDLSVFEIFVPLTGGGTVILAENALQLPILPERGRVRLVNTVPSAAAELCRLEAIPEQVRTVNLAGEALAADLVDQLYERCDVWRVLDLYGPTENTTYSTYDVRQKKGPETIGRPISNTEVYILDQYMELVPVGVVGEIYIGGRGTSRGYWNQSDLTAARYVPNPFTRSKGGGDRLYRTGDFGRFREDGRIEYRGRADQQVKIRGYRIETGEIEVVLRTHPDVTAAAVALRPAHDGSRQLVAYLVAQNGATLDSRALREHVRGKLPEYMVPSAIVQLPTLPLTPSGKVNRRFLPEPDASGQREHVAPETAVEEAVVAIWAEVLGVNQISVRDSFFDLGGHSLLATRVLSRLRTQFQLELPLRALFEFPTVRGMASLIEKNRAAGTMLAHSERFGPAGRANQELNTLFDEILQLSEEEAQSLLAKEGV